MWLERSCADDDSCYIFLGLECVLVCVEPCCVDGVVIEPESDVVYDGLALFCGVGKGYLLYFCAWNRVVSTCCEEMRIDEIKVAKEREA